MGPPASKVLVGGPAVQNVNLHLFSGKRQKMQITFPDIGSSELSRKRRLTRPQPGLQIAAAQAAAEFSPNR